MKKRVLFVDDEPNILEGLRHRLRRQHTKWDMVFAASGKEALEILARDRFDVIVTDMRMPQMDGATLLRKVQAQFPNVVRVVLSGHSELEAAMRAVPVAHQFLTKPCDPGVLENVIERACRLQSLINDPLVQQVVGRISNLPSCPQTYSALRVALARENSSTDDVAGILKRDPAMCAKTLQLVNSAFFRLPRALSRIEEAVAYLGFNTIKNVALAVGVFHGVGAVGKSKVSVDSLQDHAVSVGRFASRLFSDKVKSEDAFVAGLLHDIGRLVFAMEMPEDMDKVLGEMRSRAVPMHSAELTVFGITHSEVGAYLLGLWGLPYPIVEAVANHHTPSRVDSKEFGLLAAVHVADALVNEAAFSEGSGKRGPFPSLDVAYIEALGKSRQMAEWREMARQEVGLVGGRVSGGDSEVAG